jgi:hypothetical protein
MKSCLLLLLLLAPCSLRAQQTADESFNPVIAQPMYNPGTGTTIYIDEGHNNFHTKDGRYKPFANLLAKDGYLVESLSGEFDSKTLENVKILVIANPLNATNTNNRWYLPTPSAYTEKEIFEIFKWVNQGGSLFLIVDHMPWPGATEELAKAFGFTFYNGFTLDVVNPSYFLTNNGTIIQNVITTGRNSSEKVNIIPNTEGQAFKIPPDATPILLFDNSSLMLMPDTAWNFHSKTPLVNIKGWSQSAYKLQGKGRIVVNGEASMFSAQIGQPGNRKMGMNRDDAPDNYKLLLNIIHWLDGKLD